VSRDQLQVYLDEFVFRHNRRRQPMAAAFVELGYFRWASHAGLQELTRKTAPRED
jgi:hypothetical protein